jgi:hypothetical protein
MSEYYQFIPGFMQGITRVTISYPFDVVKINMQKMHYNNTYNAFKEIFKTDPIKFYRGASLSYTTIGIERSLQFYLLEKFNKQGKNPFYSSFIISTFNSIYNIPIQFITTNISNNKTKIGTFKYIKYIYQTKINPYKGYFIEMPKNILASTIYYSTYYTIRNYYGENKYLAPYYGAISGICVWLIIFPIDTIRTENITNNKTIKNIIKYRMKTNGLKSFYLGISPVLFRTIPSASIGMFVYEYFREKINAFKI